MKFVYGRAQDDSRLSKPVYVVSVGTGSAGAATSSWVLLARLKGFLNSFIAGNAVWDDFIRDHPDVQGTRLDVALPEPAPGLAAVEQIPHLRERTREQLYHSQAMDDAIRHGIVNFFYFELDVDPFLASNDGLLRGHLLSRWTRDQLEYRSWRDLILGYRFQVTVNHQHCGAIVLNQDGNLHCSIVAGFQPGDRQVTVQLSCDAFGTIPLGGSPFALQQMRIVQELYAPFGRV